MLTVKEKILILVKFLTKKKKCEGYSPKKRSNVFSYYNISRVTDKFLQTFPSFTLQSFTYGCKRPFQYSLLKFGEHVRTLYNRNTV